MLVSNSNNNDHLGLKFFISGSFLQHNGSYLTLDTSQDQNFASL